MTAYLIAEEGPLSGMVISLEKGKELVMGRDPDESGITLEDPMVSRRHAICKDTPQGYVLENLSTINPVTQNGKVIADSALLKEGDILQIGSTFFRFTLEAPTEEKVEEVSENPEDLSLLSFENEAESRWMLKVLTGPNAGAEFSMNPGSTYTIGKDPSVSEIVFQDLSVSRQHARITLDAQGDVYIEDLGSRNGVLVNGHLIMDKHKLASQDVVALGTTTFLVIDKQQPHETLVSVSAPSFIKKEEERTGAATTAAAIALEEEGKWKEMKISKKHLLIFGVSALALMASFGAMLALFHTETIVVEQKDESKHIEQALKNFPGVQFSYNEKTGKVFLVGHLLTIVDKQELLYLLNNIPYIRSLEDNVVVDQLVWQNMNALIMSNTLWEGVSIHAPTPGRFVMKGYLQTAEQMQALSDFINVNFPYLDRLENQVVVENDLNLQIQGMLIQENFTNVQFQLTNGELVFAGKIGENVAEKFDRFIHRLKSIPGIRSIKNFVIKTSAQSARVDISQQYQVTGFSKTDGSNFFVVINGKILSSGDNIDGMIITAIEPNLVLLEKDGVKFRINYNLQ